MPALAIVAAVALSLGFSWSAVEFACRQERWHKGVALDAVAAAVEDLRDRLAESRIPPSRG